MHGLESGPNGTKARYLRENFSKVYIPDMQMSAFNPTRRNSPSRVILCFVVLTMVFAWWRSWGLQVTTALVNQKVKKKKSRCEHDMSLRTRARAHAHTHTHTHTQRETHTHTHTHRHTHRHTHIHTHSLTHSRTHIHTCT